MPSRKNPAPQNRRGAGRGRGGARSRGGAVQKRQSNGRGSPTKAFRGGGRGGNAGMSEAAARQKLLQAKRTLQAAIKYAFSS